MKIVLILLFSIQAMFGTAAVVQRKSCITTTRIGSVTCTFDSSVTTGNMVAVGMVDDGGTCTKPITPTDNHSNSYNSLGNSSGTATYTQLHAAYNVTGGATFTVTLTCSSGTGWPQVFLVEYSGMPASPATDVALIYAPSNTASQNCGTIWTSNNNDLVIAVAAITNGSSNVGIAVSSPFSAGTFAQNDSCCSSGGLADYVSSAKGDNSANFTSTSTASYKCTVAALVVSLDSVGTQLVQAKACVTGTGRVASITCTLLNTPAVGNTILVSANGNTGGLTAFGVSDNQSNSYSSVVNKTSGGNASAIYCATASTSSGTFTITITPTGVSPASINAFAFELHGISCTADVTGGTTSSTSGSPYSCGSVSTTGASDYVLAVWAPAAASPSSGATAMQLSPSSGFTLEGAQLHAAFVSTTNVIGATEDQITSSSGSYSPGFTSTNEGTITFACSIAAFSFSASAAKHHAKVSF